MKIDFRGAFCKVPMAKGMRPDWKGTRSGLPQAMERVGARGTLESRSKIIFLFAKKKRQSVF